MLHIGADSFEQRRKRSFEGVFRAYSSGRKVFVATARRQRIGPASVKLEDQGVCVAFYPGVRCAALERAIITLAQ